MDEQQVEPFLLTTAEREACERLASGEAPYSQRALALLALADGASLAEAAAHAGLTENQVKLWRGRFRNSRLAVFPAELLVAEATTSATPAVSDPTAVETEVTAVPEKKKQAKKEKKEKSKKKDKKSKKEKKDKKGKKEKKEKKRKKEKKEKKGKKEDSKGKSKKKTKKP